MKIRIDDVYFEADDNKVENELRQTYINETLEVKNEDEIADKISDDTGFLVKNFSYTILEKCDADEN